MRNELVSWHTNSNVPFQAGYGGKDDTLIFAGRCSLILKQRRSDAVTQKWKGYFEISDWFVVNRE